MAEIKGLFCPLMSTKNTQYYCRTDCALYPGNGKKCVSQAAIFLNDHPKQSILKRTL